MRKYFFEALSLLLLLGGLAFFCECVRFVGRQEYLGAIFVLFIGLSVTHVGAELARLALAERDG